MKARYLDNIYTLCNNDLINVLDLTIMLHFPSALAHALVALAPHQLNCCTVSTIVIPVHHDYESVLSVSSSLDRSNAS